MYKARKQLSVIDWNLHVTRSQATNKKGDKQLVTWKYNQRPQEWNEKIVKEEKSYLYMPLLLAKIFHGRVVDSH